MFGRGTYLRATAFLGVVLLVSLAAGGCTMKAEKDIVGAWRTQLTGYNTIASGVTRYDQTLDFSDAGTVVMDNTLPGDVNHVTGRYELTKIDGSPAVKITWDIPVDKPSLLYYRFQGENLLTSRAPGSLNVSQELNIGNQDPVVYIRLPKSPGQ